MGLGLTGRGKALEVGVRALGETLVLLGAWGLVVTVAVALSGCRGSAPADELPQTWMPLPTIGPAATNTALPPTATTISTATFMPTRLSTPTREPTETPSPEDVAAVAAWARDQAWAHLVSVSPTDRLQARPSWVARSAEALMDSTSQEYQAGEWRATVSVAVVPPGAAIYRVQVNGPDRFEWAAQVEADGTITAEPVAWPTSSPTPETVSGWRGTLHRLPDDEKYDDFFRVLGGEDGQFGIVASDPALETRLASFRDTGRIIRVWGTLQRQVADYGEVQILVDRLEEELPPPTPVPDSVLVEAWTGVLLAAPGLGYDDYFDAQYPGGEYGIASFLPKLANELIAHRDTGTVIRVWGILDYGVTDYGSKRILVTRIEVVGR